MLSPCHSGTPGGKLRGSSVARLRRSTSRSPSGGSSAAAVRVLSGLSPRSQPLPKPRNSVELHQSPTRDHAVLDASSGVSSGGGGALSGWCVRRSSLSRARSASHSASAWAAAVRVDVVTTEAVATTGSVAREARSRARDPCALTESAMDVTPSSSES